MKKRYAIGLVMAAVVLQGCNEQKVPAASELTLDSEVKKVSYGMGLGLGKRIKADGIEIDADAFVRAMQDAAQGKEPLMTDEEIATAMQNFQKAQMEKRQQEQQAIASKNKTESEAFLAENGKKEGVVTLESGLQYKVISAGEGAKPTAEDEVEVHYRGTLIDGTEFDSSYKRGNTISFPVNGVIAGWTEALQLMPAGSKWELYIPSDLAYGPGGTGGAIGPNAALIFEVELVAVKEKEAPKADAAG